MLYAAQTTAEPFGVTISSWHTGPDGDCWFEP
jgi:proteasome lid subunit RPN8/RPN11